MICNACRATAHLRLCIRQPRIFIARAAEITQSPFRTCIRLNLSRPFKTTSRFWEGREKVRTTAKQNGRFSPPKTSEIKRLLQLAHPERWKIAGAVCLLAVSSSVSMAVPFCIGKVIDVIYTSSQEGKMSERLSKICKILLVVFFIGAVANFGRSYFMQVAGQNVIKRLRENLFQSVIKQEMGFFDKTRTGDLITRLSADTALVGRSVTMNISDGLRSTAQAIGGIGLMIFVSPKLAAISMGIVPPIALASIFYGRYVRKITRQVQDSLAKSTEVAEEKISNIRTVRAFAHEVKEMKVYKQKIDHVLNLSYKEALASSIFWGSTGLSGNMVVLAVFYFGGHMMNESLITVGELSAFLLYAAYVGISISGLSSFYSEMMRGLGASTRLWKLVDRQPRIPIAGGKVPQEPLVGNIEFRDVKFAYPSRSDSPIFEQLSLVVPAGQMTAVVGPSGSGKSTLAALILRLYEPLQGDVFIDGHCLRELDPAWVRRQIGTVSQEPVLFSTTIAENIAYGAEDPDKVPMEEIVEAARKANAYNFISRFPEGFDTLVGERGLLLSGGQKQRIAIARAILKNPKILLLDEATSALDAESEFLVQEALGRLMVGRTVLTIAHRLSTIRSADQIAVLQDHAVAEVGTYDSLIRLPDGIFRKLVEHQTISAT